MKETLGGINCHFPETDRIRARGEGIVRVVMHGQGNGRAERRELRRDI